MSNSFMTIPELVAEAQERHVQTILDAQRYRWLRQAGAWESEIGIDILCEDPAKFDAAVDEQMKFHESVRVRPD